MEVPSPVSPEDPIDLAPETSPVTSFLRRLFPLYCIFTAVISLGYALYDHYQLDGDAIAYMDIGDCMRAHQWSGIVNGYWHPMYPAFLSLGHMLFRATLPTELRAYYFVNFGIFLLEMAAVVAFTDALVRLRTSLQPSAGPTDFLLTRYPLRYLGLALVVIDSQRELSLGKVRPDALLQALLLFGVAALLTHLATARVSYAAVMGVALGCAYLTKSFAFLFAFLCIFTVVIFRWLWLKHPLSRILPAAGMALVCFGLVAGPYVAALSRQKHRLDFGDSGSLNYAWYVGGTEKMHLQPYMTSQFGTADVSLKHPEKELLHSPLIVSYAQLPYGTYPAWFDTTYWNDQIKPHFTLSGELSRGSRNCVLVVRYLFNHPEALLLLAFLVSLGARLTLGWRAGRSASLGQPSANPFWIVPFLLGVTIWGIYATVNTEERYVAVAYLSIILALFATLRLPEQRTTGPKVIDARLLRPIASALILLLALLATGESLRAVLEDRRNTVMYGYAGGWYSPTMTRVADALQSLKVRPGDTVACIGFVACLDDQYWARLAGVRITTEVYDPAIPVATFLERLPNREEAIAMVRGQGAKVLVGNFGNARMRDSEAALRDWRQLGDTPFYALPLEPPAGPQRFDNSKSSDR